VTVNDGTDSNPTCLNFALSNNSVAGIVVGSEDNDDGLDIQLHSCCGPPGHGTASFSVLFLGLSTHPGPARNYGGRPPKNATTDARIINGLGEKQNDRPDKSERTAKFEQRAHPVDADDENRIVRHDSNEEGGGCDVIKPHFNDILLPTGSRVTFDRQHPGNAQLTEISGEVVRKYVRDNQAQAVFPLPRADKYEMTLQIMKSVQEMTRPGRFLKEDDAGNWFIIGKHSYTR